MREFFSLKNHHSVVPLCGFEVSRATKDAPCAACVSPFLPKAMCGDYEVPDKVRISFPSVFQSLGLFVHNVAAPQITPETREYVKDTIQVILNGYDGLETSGSLIPGFSSCRWRLPQICTTVKIDDDDHSTDRHLNVGFFGDFGLCSDSALCLSVPTTTTDHCRTADAGKIQATFDPTTDNTFSVEFLVCCSVLQGPAYGCGLPNFSVTRPMWTESKFKYASQKLDPPFKFPIKLDLIDQYGFDTGSPPHIFLEEAV